MDRASALIVVGLIANLVFISHIFLAIFGSVFVLTRLAKNNKMLKNIVHFFADNALIFSFFIALFATGGSLFFSEIAHFNPCKLCWYQRIFMYPQVIILGIAAFKNDLLVKKYVLPLSIIGFVIGIYHYLLQMSPIPLPCSDEVANCALKQVAFYGYITIPLMSATAFALIILFFLISSKKK